MLIISDISIPIGLSLRDPLKTELGRKIISQSINLIDEIGFEAFTFKKLAIKMDSNETSLYRYFENKHLLLLYLVVWYWNWVSYLIDYNTRNIEDPNRKLDIIIDNFVDATKENPSVDFVNEKKLHHLIISESSKAYHTKDVDKENKDGFFKAYKKLIQKVADVILEIDPKFPYPHSFGSNLFEMANNQIYFAEHLPRLTDIHVENDDFKEVVLLMKFYKDRMFNRS
ncbi:MAG: TetR/AcrR family transcriptional regulator [Bacteroidia bacterium]|nr:TetR/AcrR family transcriptional regulator [Bacteroidia bacterium]MBT8229352.1 TetR/AcrR family transcriptional regulator [Bacteroidia bacterium]